MKNRRDRKTSRGIASKAGEILSNPKSTAAMKSVAASALTQTPAKPGGKSGSRKPSR